MRPAIIWSLPMAVLLLHCVPVRPAPSGPPTLPAGPQPVTAAPQEVAPAQPAEASPFIDPGQEEFETRVMPILQAKCNPCHFPGGKMYTRMPFDKPGTIRVLGTALFTRIRDEEEREVIRAFLGVPAESLPEPP
jgi:hypothetical protein